MFYAIITDQGVYPLNAQAIGEAQIEAASIVENGEISGYLRSFDADRSSVIIEIDAGLIQAARQARRLARQQAKAQRDRVEADALTEATARAQEEAIRLTEAKDRLVVARAEKEAARLALAALRVEP